MPRGGRKKVRQQQQDGDPEPVDPTVQYTPLDLDPKFRRGRVIDLAGQDVLKSSRSLARMRVWTPTAQGRVRWTQSLMDAPLDWFEYYSNIRVESWIYMWIQAFCRGRQAWLGTPIYQHYIPGKYTTGKGGTGRKVGGGAFVDFAWLPEDRGSIDPIVLLEVDENAHSSAGWDAERYRELFVFQELGKAYRRNRSILLIRLNPHEYKDKEKILQGRDPNVFTTEPSRDIRMGNVGQMVMWAFGRSTHPDRDLVLRHGITIAFCYYDKWYMDEPGDPTMPIHMHHYRDLRVYTSTVNASSGRNIPIEKRTIFMEPKWWDWPGVPRVQETTAALNPFVPLPQQVKDSIVGYLTVNQQQQPPAAPPAPAPPAPPAPPPPPAPPAPPAQVPPQPPPRRNPPRGARPPRRGQSPPRRSQSPPAPAPVPPPAQPPAQPQPRRNQPRDARPPRRGQSPPRRSQSPPRRSQSPPPRAQSPDPAQPRRNPPRGARPGMHDPPP